MDAGTKQEQDKREKRALGVIEENLKVAQYRRLRGYTFTGDALVTEQYTRIPVQDWPSALTQWLKAVAAEGRQDVTVLHSGIRNLRMDQTDGALTRVNEVPGGTYIRGSAYTRHAWSQFVALCGGKGAGVHADDTNWTRASYFADLVAGCTRTKNLVLRTRVPQVGPAVIRGVVSEGHALGGYDDHNVALAVDEWVTAYRKAQNQENSPLPVARVVRTDSMTWGWVSMGGAVESPTTPRLTLSLGNSEVGASSVVFRGAIMLNLGHADGTLIEGRRGVSISETETNSLRHVLPRGAEAYRLRVARERMTAAAASAFEGSRALAEAWAIALMSMPDAAAFPAAPEAMNTAPDEVLLDLIEQSTGFPDDTRERFAAVLKNEKALTALPRCSRAHIAGVWAVLANSGNAGTIEVFMEQARKWLAPVEGWSA